MGTSLSATARFAVVTLLPSRGRLLVIAVQPRSPGDMRESSHVRTARYCSVMAEPLSENGH